MAYADAQPLTTIAAPALPATLRRVLLLGPPLALAVLEYFHPAPDVTAQAVMEVATWFTVFHALQLVLIGLVALSVVILAESLGRAATWTTRLGIGTFLVFFSAYDGIAGMATGLAMRTARDLSPVQQDAIFTAVKDWPGFDPAVFTLNIVGTLAWFVTVSALAVAARRAGVPRAEWILLAAAAVFLLGGHPFPFGTIAFGSLFAAALLHELRRDPDGRAGQPEASLVSSESSRA